MRDFRLQAVVNSVRILQSKEMSLGILLPYSWWWLVPMRQERVRPNKMFDLRDLSRMKDLLLSLGKRDPTWFPRLYEPTTLGIRAWEYGILLKNVSFRAKKVLDAGVGNSRLPHHLARLGAKVSLLDMEDPLEETDTKKDINLRFVLGDMTKLTFKNNTFDRVICISAIEHVDMKKGGKFYSPKTYLERALQTIRELARVTKKGGIVYLTTDFYLPEQKTDSWVGSDKKIRGGFPWTYIEMFTDEMRKSRIKLSPLPIIDKEILLRDHYRANYRGRFFTTIAFMGVKT